MPTIREKRALMIVALDALDEKKARKLLRAIVLTLWPNGGGDIGTECNADTFEELAGVFQNFGVNPDK
jgi:hypothetical protein